MIQLTVTCSSSYRSFELSDATPAKPATVPDRIFERPLYKSLTRGFGALAVLVLNIALIGSDITQLQAHQRVNLLNELVTYGLAIGVDFVILWPVIFEIRRVSFWEDKVVFDTIFWRSVLRWNEILEYKKSKVMSTVTLRTARVKYILNKKDFPKADELIAKLEGKIGVEAKSA